MPHLDVVMVLIQDYPLHVVCQVGEVNLVARTQDDGVKLPVLTVNKIHIAALDPLQQNSRKV